MDGVSLIDIWDLFRCTINKLKVHRLAALLHDDVLCFRMSNYGFLSFPYVSSTGQCLAVFAEGKLVVCDIVLIQMVSCVALMIQCYLRSDDPVLPGHRGRE